MRNETSTTDVSHVKYVNVPWHGAPHGAPHGALEAGLIMRTDWEVIRQAANDRTLRVWSCREGPLCSQSAPALNETLAHP